MRRSSYRRTFAALHAEPSAKLLDLTPARLFSPDMFTHLAEDWTASEDTVPRLGIVVSFERWVTLREPILAALQPVSARGVRIEVFYEEQAQAGHLDAWFQHGQVVHNVASVTATLTMRWQPSPMWPMVIETLACLVRTHASTVQLAGVRNASDIRHRHARAQLPFLSLRARGS